MAKRQIIEIIDDLSGETIRDGGGAVTFSIDGQAYEIDLSDENERAMRAAFQPYIDAARRIGLDQAVKRPQRTPERRERRNIGEIRSWARANGMEVSERGRIAQPIFDAYERAH